MDPAAFRRKVRETFGPGLEHATAVNVREFVAWFATAQADPGAIPEAGRYVLDEVIPASLEGSVKGFLLGELATDPEEARQRLWVTLLELYYAVIEFGEAERFPDL